MTFNAGQIIVWLITGALAGFIVGQLLRGRGFGFIGNLVLGLLGALVGGALFQLLDIRIGDVTLTFSLADLIAAVVGALLLVVVLGLVAKRR